jgi:hypothetical protein
MDDDATPRLTRCFRGHSTPAGKTFCESCGAALGELGREAEAELAPEPAAEPGAKTDVIATRNRRRHLRVEGDVVPTSDRRRRFSRG